MISCACCERVKIFYTNQEKQLCFNMIYQRNGLNLDISLDSLIIKSITVANYKPFQMCSSVPRLPFTTICVYIQELKQYERSITVCPRLEVTSKKESWQIRFSCGSISTQLLPQ
ncbi:uncharacterized protein LOC106646241 [Copidosoma floridanum]|uniref:uncharacterized protein LOC106646241 n=1 Tax=Copidosoma floridanum TaxID=29053 RepID=UPI000C6F8E75|nr:uncharacterized protein LOC106646241 [Copidosoma floridanum]